MKKIIILLVVLALMLPLVTACDKNKHPEETTVVSTDTFNLTKDLLSNYIVIIPDGSSTQLNSYANTLRQNIKEKTSVDLSLKDDFIKEGSDKFKINEYEILVGNTNRAETAALYSKLRINDYGYALINKKLVIFGHSDTNISKAISLFNLNILENYTDSSEYIVKDGTQELKYGKYDVESFTINQIDISNYSVVYPTSNAKGESTIAKSFCDYITAVSGYVLKCYPDHSPYDGGYEIQIGDTNRINDIMKSIKATAGADDSKAYIQKQGKLVWLSGSNNLTIESSKSNLLNLIETQNNTNKTITLQESTTYTIKSQQLNVLNYNVRYDFEADKRNPDDVIVSIKQQNPDDFGTNETTPAWITKLKKAFDSEYTCFAGKPADTGEDSSYDSIFYRTTDFELIESGTKWMSASPDRISKFSQSKHYCTFSYVILKHRVSGVEFMYINTHLVNDSTTPEQNRQARVLQAGVMLSFISGYTNIPIIVAGDFNASFNGEGPKQMKESGIFSNAYDVADESILDGGTFVLNTNTEGLQDAYTNRTSTVLDHIFVTKGNVIVQKFEAVDNIMNGKYPSDHLPVQAYVTIYQ